jgi:hypothetical protein
MRHGPAQSSRSPPSSRRLRQTLLDANAPLYSLVHLWSLVFGLSNEALRFPSLLFGTLTALRGRALRTWPAALLFLPAFAWLSVHLPHMAEYADPRFAWFDQLGLGDIPALMVYTFGGPLIALGLIAVAMIALVLRTASANLDVQSAPYPWLVAQQLSAPPSCWRSRWLAPASRRDT